MQIEQKSLWNKKHKRGDHTQYSVRPSDFATEAGALLTEPARILDLGCGVGHDSAYFSQQGHKVVATDLSDVVIEQNRSTYHEKTLEFQVLDMSKLPWTFSDNVFDVVYAHLSLHYFTADVTRVIFEEIHRVLKPEGRLFFVCKSIKDRYYGKGEEIEKDMFLLDGHIRHLYSEEFANSMMDGLFRPEVLDYGTNDFYGKKSRFLRCWAKSLK